MIDETGQGSIDRKKKSAIFCTYGTKLKPKEMSVTSINFPPKNRSNIKSASTF